MPAGQSCCGALSAHAGVKGQAQRFARRTLRVAYHDACHLAHAQGVTVEPRALLRSVAGIELLELGEPELCCGSAGTFNLEQPVIAKRLGERKARHALAGSPEMIATGNVGCMTQLRSRLDALGSSMPVLPTMEVLDRADRGAAGSASRGPRDGA